jgi:hypothetical protein
MPVIPVLGRLRKEDCEFKVSLYITSPCLIKTKETDRKRERESSFLKYYMYYIMLEYGGNRELFIPYRQHFLP